MRRIVVGGLVAILALTGCSGQANDPGKDASGTNNLSYDVSSIQKVDAIAAMVPSDLASSGRLVIGAAIDYAPAEFRADDLQTAIGYDVDLGKALGRVMGLEAEVSDAEFASLLPGMGSAYDIGISSFTITEERTANYNMVSYIMVGSSFAVQAGNPKGFDPDKLCGTTIGVQTGTYQEEELADFSADCVARGEQAIEVMSQPVQSDVTTNVIGGRMDAMYADSTVADYAVALTNDQMEVIGGIRDAAPQGIVVPQDDAELTAAVQAAMQYLIDQGIWADILNSWGVSEDAALPVAQVNPGA